MGAIWEQSMVTDATGILGKLVSSLVRHRNVCAGTAKGRFAIIGSEWVAP